MEKIYLEKGKQKALEAQCPSSSDKVKENLQAIRRREFLFLPVPEASEGKNIQEKQCSEIHRSSKPPCASEIPWPGRQEGVEDYMDYRWQGGNNSDGRYTRNLSSFRLHSITAEMGEGQSMFILSNRGTIGYEHVSDGVFTEVPGAGGVAVALRSIKDCGLPVKILSAPMSQGDRDAMAAKKQLGFVPIESGEHNESSNKNDRENFGSGSNPEDDMAPVQASSPLQSRQGHPPRLSLYQNLFCKSRGMDDSRQRIIKNHQDTKNEFVADIMDKEYDEYYNKISSNVLWFSLHSMSDFVSSSASEIEHYWKSYTKVNQKFVDTVSDMMSKEQVKKQIIIIQDYHLLQASSMLREKHKNIVLQHFIHVPWPKPKDWNWNKLSRKIVEDIYNGMSGNDIIGFQTKEYATNFLEGVKSFVHNAEVNFEESTVHWNGRNTQVRVYAISIDVDKTREMANTAKEHEINKTESIQGSPEEMQIIVSVDRMDPTKNNLVLLDAFDLLLDKYPELCEKVIYKPRWVPSRGSVPAYQDHERGIRASVDTIISKRSTPSWTPIQPEYGNDHMDAVGKMVSANVAVVNSLKDGMNMVALEIVTVIDNGVLALSVGAGAHGPLEEGVLSIQDSNNAEEIAEVIHEGLKMPREERQRKNAPARKYVENNDLNKWVLDQIHDINEMLSHE